jgi:hypothetical protein
MEGVLLVMVSSPAGAWFPLGLMLEADDMT